MPNGTPNVAREIVLDLNLPRTIPGVTVSRACLSGLQVCCLFWNSPPRRSHARLEAVLQAVVAIEHGDAECIVAGGSDSLSNGMCPPSLSTLAVLLMSEQPSL
jgi:acetyl-CoA acyltransferase